MEATKTQRGPLNEAQMSVLRLLGHMKTVEEVQELHKLILAYYDYKIQKDLDKLWDEGKWSQEIIDNLLKEDVHAKPQTEYAV